MLNPPIALSDGTLRRLASGIEPPRVPQVMTLESTAHATLLGLSPPSEFSHHVRLLSWLNTSCPLSPEERSAAPTVLTYLRHAGETLRFDPRLRTLENTLEAPSSLVNYSSLRARRGACPTAPKTFLNAATCVRASACEGERGYGSASLTLDAATLRDFYVKGGSHVYVVTGLRLEGGAALSPCRDTSRWQRQGGGCGGGATSLGWSAESALVSALRAAAQSASTPAAALQTVDVSLAECTDAAAPPAEWANAVGGRVEVDGICWQHVHPQEASVWDFSYWTFDHPGTTPTFDPIRAVASAGAVELAWPASHSMNRWANNHRDGLRYLGRLDAVVDFAALPSEVQTAGMAEAIGALATSGGAGGAGTEACGSPGEVANDPAQGHRFHMYLTNREKGLAEMVEDRRYSALEMGKVTVHTGVALRAPDQLRQRVAWALSQVRGCFFVLLKDGFLMAADGCGWLRMAVDGCGWLRMAADGFRWLPMASDGFRWLPMSCDGSPRCVRELTETPVMALARAEAHDRWRRIVADGGGGRPGG